MDKQVLFSEKQRFNQIWLWVILLGLTALFLFGLVKQVVLGEPFGTKPMPDGGLILVNLLLILLSLLFKSLRLETYIKWDGIYVRFFPFHFKFK